MEIIYRPAHQIIFTGKALKLIFMALPALKLQIYHFWYSFQLSPRPIIEMSCPFFTWYQMIQICKALKYRDDLPHRFQIYKICEPSFSIHVLFIIINLRRTFSGQGVSLKARFDWKIIHEVSTTAALDADASGLGPNGWCSDHDPRDLYQTRHLFRLSKNQHIHIMTF